jgi:transposase
VDDRGVSGPEQASREELLALVAAQARMLEVAQQRLAEQAALIAEQATRIAELERRVGRNSRNSSSPLAADGLDKPPVRSVRAKGARRAGKQPGAPGATLSQVAKPDVVAEHFPAACGRCALPLGRDRVVGEVVRRQVFDLPEVKVEVTEHQMFALACDGCGHATRADAPVEAVAPACYGPTVTAIAAYLSAQHHIPFDRVVEIMAEVAGVDLSAGFAVAACRRVEDAVEPANEAIKDAIAAAPVAHFDESVTRVAGGNHWMHTAATATLTAYHIDEHGRSAESIKAFGILPRFGGVAVHDAYSAYNGFDCAHALCNAHIIREAVGVGEFDPAARTDGWAADLVDLLGDAHRWIGHWGARGHHRLPQFKLDDLHHRYDAIVGRALAVHPPRTGKQTPARKLALRLRNRKQDFLRFATDFTIAFTNNIAEQAIRMVKTKTKVSNGFRTLRGAQTFLAIRGYISTVRKNGLRALPALRDALLGNPWMPTLPSQT